MALPTPIAYWPFDEATGTTSVDASGNGWTVTLSLGTWDTSSNKKFGASALANNATGYAANLASHINVGTVHSIAFWMNGWNGSTSSIVIAASSAAEFYGCFVEATRLFYSSGPGNYVSVTHGGGLTGSHHIVVTRNGTTITFYKDGGLLSSGTIGTNTANSFHIIGGYVWSAGFNFLGTIDDLRLYNVELTSAQVTELYALDPTASVSAETTQFFIIS